MAGDSPQIQAVPKSKLVARLVSAIIGDLVAVLTIFVMRRATTLSTTMAASNIVLLVTILALS